MLDLSHNKFTGHIPHAVHLMATLLQLGMDRNRCSGSTTELSAPMKCRDFSAIAIAIL